MFTYAKRTITLRYLSQSVTHQCKERLCRRSLRAWANYVENKMECREKVARAISAWRLRCVIACFEGWSTHVKATRHSKRRHLGAHFSAWHRVRIVSVAGELPLLRRFFAKIKYHAQQCRSAVRILLKWRARQMGTSFILWRDTARAISGASMLIGRIRFKSAARCFNTLKEHAKSMSLIRYVASEMYSRQTMSEKHYLFKKWRTAVRISRQAKVSLHQLAQTRCKRLILSILETWHKRYSDEIRVKYAQVKT